MVIKNIKNIENNDLVKASLRLFKSIPLERKGKISQSQILKNKTLKNKITNSLEITIPKGFILSPDIVDNFDSDELNKLIIIVEKELCLSAEQMNSSFHKSWQKVKNASLEQLYLEQILHYFTTYGFEELGVYDESSVYIPKEKLEIPQIEDTINTINLILNTINLILIKGCTKSELKEKLLKILSSGIALKEDTIKDVLEIINFVGFKEKEVELIKNKEMKIMLYDGLNIVPENPVEFLRYVVYKSTKSSLLIKDKKTIKKIKEDIDSLVIEVLFKKYEKKYGFENLATIFYRFKPLFLALRTTNKNKEIINKIRRLAKKYHKPMEESYLNTITSRIKNLKKGEKINKKKLEEELDNVNVFRKIRLAYALKYRTRDVDSILYRVRNGSSYATEFRFDKKDEAKEVLKIVLDSIVEDVKKNVKGKKIYIPDYIKYTLPATEKQFVGDFPGGSYVIVDKDIVFGIHWDNVQGRTDLDLSLINNSNSKFGWDARYRNADASILFSGDMTSASGPNGASELFYVKRQIQDDFIMYVNYYNYDDKVKIPYSIVVAKEQVKDFKLNYMINPNNVIALAKSNIDKKQKILGLVSTTTRECRFYFVESNQGNLISSSDKEYVKQSRDYLSNFYKNTISLNDVLERAGAKIFDKVNDKEKCDIDLSPQCLEKDKIINLLVTFKRGRKD